MSRIGTAPNAETRHSTFLREVGAIAPKVGRFREHQLSGSRLSAGAGTATP